MAGIYSKDILPHDVQKRLERGEVLSLLDVREQDEWESGHIPGARHIPLGALGFRHKELDPHKETIVICRSGNRSGLACEFLESMGYKVFNMQGGMSRWTGEIAYGK
ncbi:rhodanese-like domain-containing protein [Paenibacillus thermoaerophilus]|uniref:Rhodanese-like domain-containing protein n=1 Tax=Paenibacillus thermoaerophilus TaxID=1215385 RepID=A0ABW2V5H6_9BACL|nr:rhodanese-like domain-containing protein [Paenibacillus thermoaerophilus]TMV18850.1 rhodanese-like domain-containing protein [Paenibacillus thermoaerophilus]